MSLAEFSFWFFSGVAVLSALMVLASRNPVHSVLFLISTFIAASGLFVLIGAEYLAMVLIVVYVGAVAVLFLFVVMMLDIGFVEMNQGFLQYLPAGAALSLVVLFEIMLVISVTDSPDYGEFSRSRPVPAASQGIAVPAPDTLGEADRLIGRIYAASRLQQENPYMAAELAEAMQDDIELLASLVPVNVVPPLSGTGPVVILSPYGDMLVGPDGFIRVSTLSWPDNIESIGLVLYTEYVHYFQIAGIILLVAMIGAIVLTFRSRRGVRRQDPGDQVSRRREDSVELVDLPSGQGLL